MQQRTIASSTRLSGVGLHTGEEVVVELVPADVDTGVSFVRVDIDGEPAVKASVSNLAQRPRRTALADGRAEVHTTEHLMAALWAAGVDNVVVRINGPELPGLDGSALPFYEAIRSAGVVAQDRPRREWRLKTPLAVQQNGASVMAMPFDGGLRVGYTLDYRQTGLPSAQQVGIQYFEATLDEEAFARDIAPARTFVLREEVEVLRAEGLGRGATTQNTIVLGPDGVIENELRFADEFVRHKVLDLIGDLYLMGGQIRGHVQALKSGHALNVQLAQCIQEQCIEAGRPDEAKGVARAGNGATTATEPTGGMELDAIQKLLPHRFPFLLVDRILEVGEDRIVGIKNVTANEYFFQGHFPQRPVMPGVLQVEALAQVGGVFVAHRLGTAGYIALLSSLDDVKFRRMVVPGDQLVLEATATRFSRRGASIVASARVNGRVATEAKIRFVFFEGPAEK